MLTSPYFYATLVIIVIVLIVCWRRSKPKEDFGYFKGEVATEWLPNGRDMMLLEDFAYIDPTSKQWDAPANSVVDGASIPQPFWSFTGGPFSGKYREASVVHDVACQQKQESWQDVHLMFYYACRCGGVRETKAKVMYYAVYVGGPKWVRRTVDGKPVFEMLSPPIEHFDEKQFQKIARYIETKNPSLEKLRSLKPDSPELETFESR